MKTYSTKLLLLLLLLLLVIHACIHTHLYLSLSLYIYIYIILLRRRLKARAASLCARPSRREQPSCEFDDANNSSTSSCDVYVSRGTHIYIYIYIYMYTYIHMYVLLDVVCLDLMCRGAAGEMFLWHRRAVYMPRPRSWCPILAWACICIYGMCIVIHGWYAYPQYVCKLSCLQRWTKTSAIALQALLSFNLETQMRNIFAGSPVFHRRFARGLQRWQIGAPPCSLFHNS